jgi:hypothetical protein
LKKPSHEPRHLTRSKTQLAYDLIFYVTKSIRRNSDFERSVNDFYSRTHDAIYGGNALPLRIASCIRSRVPMMHSNCNVYSARATHAKDRFLAFHCFDPSL